ncbi:hypothetical protein AGMMS50267_10900 [Spirochaetia bacterium]|nr:hypothetical protein AGMMS50267_10900 [Spirochaetia bacterium]
MSPIRDTYSIGTGIPPDYWSIGLTSPLDLLVQVTYWSPNLWSAPSLDEPGRRRNRLAEFAYSQTPENRFVRAQLSYNQYHTIVM